MKSRRDLPLEHRRVLARIDRGFGHAMPVSRLTSRQLRVAERLAASGVLARMPARGRWPERYVVTSRGSHAWGTFRDKRRSAYSRKQTARTRRDAQKRLTRAERSATNKQRWRETRHERQVRGREKVSESDDRVRQEIPPELVPLFDRVRGQIKASGRASRAEVFLEYAENHPREIYATIEDETERMIRERERFERGGERGGRDRRRQARYAWTRRRRR